MPSPTVAFLPIPGKLKPSRWQPFQVPKIIFSPPTPNPYREAAFTGKLQTSGNRFYLLTNSSEAIYLDVPSILNLKNLVGKRIMAVGSYNQKTRTMTVSDATDLEVLPSSPIPIPTLAIIPTAALSPSTNPSPPSNHPIRRIQCHHLTIP